MEHDPLKRISEKELHPAYSLIEDSRAATLTFYCGLLGVICCLGLFVCYQYIMREIQAIVEANLVDETTVPLDNTMLTQLVNEKLVLIRNVCLPIFMAANLLWVAGAYTWSLDYRKNPRNRLQRSTGGIFVFMTAAICLFIWYWIFNVIPRS